MFYNNTIFGFFASNAATYGTLYIGPTSQTIYRDFVGSLALNGLPPFRKGPNFNISRPGPATYFNNLCAIDYQARNTPRFEYGPDGIYRGLLIESTRTNQIPYSSNFQNTNTWSVLVSTDGPGAVLLSSQVLAPDNINTATLLSGLPAVGFRAISFNSFVTETNALISRSIFIKQNIGRYVFFCGSNPAEEGGNVDLVIRIFDFDTKQFVEWGPGGLWGNAVPGYPNYDTQVQILPNDWIRISVADEDTNDNLNKLTIGTAGASGWESGFYTDQDNIGSFYIWGAQYERGNTPSSYIPTNGVSVTRPADSITMPRLSGYYNPLESSFYIKGSRRDVLEGDNTFGAFVQSIDGSSFWELYGRAVGDVPIGQGFNASYNLSSFEILETETPQPNTVYTLIGSLSTDFTSMSAYYAQNQTFTNLSSVSGIAPNLRSTTLRLGQRFNTNYLNGHIQELGYWPAYIPFSELSAYIYSE
jgi:hypothetical protein